MKIIDVSHHNGVIDWEKMKGSEIQGAILRCGFGDDQRDQDDRQWQYNAGECTRLGIPFGVYLYSYAKNDQQAESEARHVLRCVEGYELKFPIYYDLEEKGTEAYALRAAEIFAPRIESAGYWCGIYASQSFWRDYLMPLGGRYTKWVARYGNHPDIPGCDMWQYTEKGTIDGISGYVDMNDCYRDFPSLIVKSKGEENSQSPGMPQEAGVYWYRVQKGDTLSEIAVRNAGGISVERLAYLNGIQNPNKIYIGQMIRCDDYLNK